MGGRGSWSVFFSLGKVLFINLCSIYHYVISGHTSSPKEKLKRFIGALFSLNLINTLCIAQVNHMIIGREKNNSV